MTLTSVTEVAAEAVPPCLSDRVSGTGWVSDAIGLRSRGDRFGALPGFTDRTTRLAAPLRGGSHDGFVGSGAVTASPEAQGNPHSASGSAVRCNAAWGEHGKVDAGNEPKPEKQVKSAE